MARREENGADLVREPADVEEVPMILRDLPVGALLVEARGDVHADDGVEPAPDRSGFQIEQPAELAGLRRHLGQHHSLAVADVSFPGPSWGRERVVCTWGGSVGMVIFIIVVFFIVVVVSIVVLVLIVVPGLIVVLVSIVVPVLIVDLAFIIVVAFIVVVDFLEVGRSGVPGGPRRRRGPRGRRGPRRPRCRGPGGRGAGGPGGCGRARGQRGCRAPRGPRG